MGLGLDLDPVVPYELSALMKFDLPNVRNLIRVADVMQNVLVAFLANSMMEVENDPQPLNLTHSQEQKVRV